MLLSILSQHKSLIFQSTLSLSLTFILTFLNIPIRFLEGLHTYIHPENLQQGDNNNKTRSGFRPTIHHNTELENQEKSLLQRKKKKGSSKFEFDESNAQIFRLQLVDGHLRSRMFFVEYRDCFVYCFIALSSLLLYCYLPLTEEDGDKELTEGNVSLLVNGAVVPVVLGLISALKVVMVIAKMSFERSASKKVEKQLSVVFGFVGVVVAGLVVFVGNKFEVVEFEFGNVDGLGKVLVCMLAGLITGLMYMGGMHNARSFWIGTDQLRWNLEIVSCGWFGKMLMYVNYLVVVFTALLWINPVTDVFVRRRSSDGNVGVAVEEFKKFRVLCLLVSGVMQIVALRPNLQMYLNEAVLSWYQRLHASKVPDLEFSRAKIFLHNYYVCLVVLQFFAPPALILLFLGLSRIEGNFFTTFPFLCSFIKEVSLFMAWWVAFVWAMITSSSLVLYRTGFLYVS